MSTSKHLSRREFLRMAGVAAAGAALAACAPPAAPAAPGAAPAGAPAQVAEKITLTVVVHPNWGPKGNVIDRLGRQTVQYLKMFPAFKERNPNVELVAEELQGDTEGRTKYLLQCRQGTQPDVTQLDGFWVAEFAALGCTYPLDDVLDKDLQADYFDAFKINYQGKVHGLVPTTAFNSMLWYRKDLFEGAGLTEPPKDWDELKVYAEKLTKRDDAGKVVRYGLTFPAQRSEHTSVVLLGFYWQGEDTFVTQDNQPAFDNQTSLDVFNFLADMYKAESVMPEVITMLYDDVQKAFFADKAAMMLHGSWMSTGIPNLAPDIAPNTGLAPNPVYPRTGKRGTNAGGWGMSITTKDPNKVAAAADFLYVTSGGLKDLYKEMVLEGGALPVLKSQADDPAYAETEWQKTIMSELPYARTRPAVEIYPDASLEWSQAFQEVLTGMKDAAQALKDAVERTNTIAKEKGYIK